jgi:hypothetical protein
MPSLSPKDRVSLCLFTYEDGRRCHTPRISSHPHFCFYHAQKETQSQATEKLAKDLTYFFSNDYLSANDLNTALGRLIPAVIRGEIKPRVARTVAYMLQTLFQSTRLAQHEYINAFGTDTWRDAISTSVTANHDYLYPPDPNDLDPEDKSEDESEDEFEDDSEAAPEPQQPTQTPPPQPPPGARPSSTDTEAALAAARALFPPRPNSTPPQSVAPPQNPVAPTPQPTSTPAENPTNSAPPPAPPTEARYLPRRRPHNPSTNFFGTNIYSPPGNRGF